MLQLSLSLRKVSQVRALFQEKATCSSGYVKHDDDDVPVIDPKPGGGCQAITPLSYEIP